MVLAAALGAAAILRLDTAHNAQARPHRPAHWLAAWTAAPQAPVAGNLSAHGFRNQTIRQIVFLSGGGPMVRIRLTNTFSSRPLAVGRASVAVPAAGAGTRAGTLRALTFGGRPSVRVPPRAEVLSDPVRLRARPLSHLVVSLYLPARTGPATEHAQARQVNYVARGDRALAAGPAGFGDRTQSWYFLAGVDVLAPARDVGAVVALGDSITDGVGSRIGADARWPNDLARRLAARGGRTLTIVDQGIGGNRLLHSDECCGVDAVARFDRDAAGQSGVRDVILLEGVNDIGFSRSRGAAQAPHTDVSARQIIDGYQRIIRMAHAAGLRVFGATLTPFRGARYWSPAGEAKRQAVNHWILTSGAFDGVVKFAAAVADPGHPERLEPAYDCGDHLHPNAAGYRAMARAVDVAALLARL